MSLTAKISVPPWEPRIGVIDNSVFDVRNFGALGDGQTNDATAIQYACNAARDHIRKTLSPGPGAAIHRTGNSWSPTVYFPPGLYMTDRLIFKPPHVSLRGAGWGRSAIKPFPGWKGQAMTTNRQGVMWVQGQLAQNTGPSALIWCLGDEEWPVGSGLKIAGMVDEISHLGFKCAEGAAIFIPGNQNHTSINNCWFNGWGDGPTGVGIIANNFTSSQQITNLFLDHNMFEGLRAAVVMDRVVIGSIDHNQIESCGNGIYVGSGYACKADNNLLTCTIPNKPFENGIWIGCGIDCSISNNTISGVTKNAIKHLGRNSKIAGNQISIKGGAQINESGYAVHIVGPAKQFGGDVSVLGGVHSHHIHGNNVDADSWPKAKAMPGLPNPAPLESIWIDEAPGEKIGAWMENNVDGPIRFRARIKT